MAQNKQLNILAWYDSIDKQNHRKWWTFNKVIPLIFEIDKLPPFQLPRDQTGDPITELKLIQFYSGIETNILTSALSTGLEVAEFDNYDLIIYPSIDALGISNIEQGFYYLKMGDGSNTWYSEVFNMCQDVSKFIKIEYWHIGDFAYSGGHIRYQYPFKNRMYIDSDIGKPSYPYEEKVIKRGGKNFPIEQISYKLYKFSMNAPEYFLDAFRVVRQHDFVKIYYSGYTYDVDEILMNDPKWENEGDVSDVQIEFKTDTIVVVNGRGLVSSDYELELGTCIVIGGKSVAKIISGSADYTNGEYTPFGGGNKVSINDGDLVLVDTSSLVQLYTFNSGSYTLYSGNTITNLYNKNTNEYFLYDSANDKFTSPRITSVSATHVNGVAFANTVVNVYGQDGISEVLIGTIFSNTFNLSGIEVDSSPYSAVKIKCSSVACDLFAESDWTSTGLTGIGINWPIGTGNTIT